MRFMLVFMIPVVLILLPTVYQIVYTAKRLSKKTSQSILMIFLTTMAFGVMGSVSAFFLSMSGMSMGANPMEPTCVIGAVFFPMLGIAVHGLLTPFIALIGTASLYHSR